MLAIYEGSAFAAPEIVDEALLILEQQIIPSYDAELRAALFRFHGYFCNNWIQKRFEKADFNLFDLVQRGNKIHTTNAAESLHRSLRDTYTAPVATLQAAGEMINSYKSHLLSQFSNSYYLPRNQGVLHKEELMQFHNREINRQSREWKFRNAVDICLQFSFYSEQILVYPAEVSSLFDPSLFDM